MKNWYALLLLVFVLQYGALRSAMCDAYFFKKNKSRCKKENKARSKWSKLFGFYPLHNSHAPHHLKKYAIMRVFNAVFLVLGSIIYFLIPRFAVLRYVFLALFWFHTGFSLLSSILEIIFLSNTKKYGKSLDYDKSRRP